MPFPKKITLWIWGIVSAILYMLVGYATERSNAFQVIATWLLLFGGYFYIVSREYNRDQIKTIVTISILFRLLFLFALPALSDDFYRFIWDGQLINEGINPYLYTPDGITGLDKELYAKLNSPHYYSIYPPVMQFVFWVSTSFASDNILVSVVIMRLFIIASEIGTVYLLYKLLQHYNLPGKNILSYALNPLIIIELTGNLHFEAIMIFFLLWAIYLLTVGKWLIAAVSFALSVVTKLVPLIFLPLLWRYLGSRRFFFFISVLSVVSVLTFIPFINSSFIGHISDSVGLYFQHFEFNASIYYLVRAVGFWVKGYNIIDIGGSILPIVFIMLLGIYTAYYKKHDSRSLMYAGVHIYFMYYLMALVVHPWYISILIVFAVFSRYKFPYIWACLAGLTYITYMEVPYEENLWLVALEYFVLLIFAVPELFRSDTKRQI